MSSCKTDGAFKSKKLFTPGPLSCTMSVKEAMLRDFGSRDEEFTAVIKDVRQRILDIIGAPSDQWTAVLLQGSGTYCVEAAVHTAVPKNSTALQKILVLSNGAYGRRLAQICAAADLSHDVLEFGEAKPYDLAQIDRQLALCPYRLVVTVHCETSSGMLNPVGSVATMVKAEQPEALYLVDAMSSFGVIPLRLDAIDFVIASANKCIQGVPGFGFVITRTEKLKTCAGNARTLSLNLCAQHTDLEKQGQFRFTPPTHALLAAQQALKEMEVEGGPEARLQRYKANATVLLDGARELGLRTLLPAENLSPIITSFHYPKNKNFNFDEFYRRLSDMGLLIYPGKVTTADCFRVGCIGDLHPADVKHLIHCLKLVFKEMGIPIPVL